MEINFYKIRRKVLILLLSHHPDLFNKFRTITVMAFGTKKQFFREFWASLENAHTWEELNLGQQILN